jgi:hypothetical protein
LRREFPGIRLRTNTVRRGKVERQADEKYRRVVTDPGGVKTSTQVSGVLKDARSDQTVLALVFQNYLSR